MSEAPQILLEHRLKTLKLPTFLREYDKVARQCAHEGLDPVAFLARLVELELIDRERRLIERRIKAAKFPTVKSLDSFQFKAIPSLNKAQVLELARCEWIERRENVIALGPSGTGKTHVSLGLGLAACQKALSVRFITAAALVHELMEARDERRLLRLQKQLANYTLLIIDELGFVPLSKTGAELLFEGVSQRYERAAVLIYVIWNISSGGLFHALSMARVSQSRAERWAKGGKVRSPNRLHCRSGTSWTNSRARFAGSASRAWLRCQKRSSGSGSNRCSGSPITPSRRMGEDWKTSSAGARGRESSRAVRAVMM